ncbi:MAG: hypothetical protein OQL06_12105 [Gammaproteobacteria bacterium]|nr:hypothetical protein [Gammaproteobacteria bacterium]
MSRKIEDNDDYESIDDDEIPDDDIPDDFEKVETRQSLLKRSSDARRKLEQLLENRELERLINGESYDWN